MNWQVVILAAVVIKTCRCDIVSCAETVEDGYLFSHRLLVPSVESIDNSMD